MNITSERESKELPAPVRAALLPYRKDLAISALLFLLCLLVFNANLRLIASGDSYPARYLPLQIWRYHALTFDPMVTIVAQGRRVASPPPDGQEEENWLAKAYWLVRTDKGGVVSLYPLVTPLVVTPLYLPAVAYLNAHGWEPWRIDHVARIMEKISASMLAALSVALLYLLLRRRAGRRSALLLAAAYGFGTTTWTISSQALWQQGLAELLIVSMLLAVTGPSTVRRVIAAGLLCGLIACNRPPDAILAMAFGVYALWWAGRKAVLFAGMALVPLVFLIAYNLGVVGHYAGGYGLFAKKSYLEHNPLVGVAGLLFSPARGLFVFSPFLLFIPCCARQALRDRSTRALTVAIGVAIALQVISYSYADWRQGAAWGPRWLTSTVPLLVWMLPPIHAALRRPGRIAFIAACVAATAIQTIGAFWYTGTSNAALYAFPEGPAAMRAAWNIRYAPFLSELQHPRAPADLATEVRGSLDIAAIADGRDLNAANWNPIAVEGWASANGRTPHEILIMFDGRTVASTQEFFVRPDVTRALGFASPTGWRITVGSRELARGEHQLAIFARVAEGGDLFFLADRKFTVAGEPTVVTQSGRDDLAASAARAAGVVAARQQTSGSWLTTHTPEMRYERREPELNTFLPSALIDVLEPVAGQSGLTASIQRGRNFLSSQIEDGGLVRYHGRPEAVGNLGCAITPDADDTALAWRIAPSARRDLLPTALGTLKRYRTAEGLYRTWLASPDHFQCLDPGKDPDPADITIQIHIQMLLAKVDPPAANDLCRALSRTIGSDTNWVYYRKTPIMPILREADLHRTGCLLDLPPSRLETTLPEQAVWVTAARMLRGLTDADGAVPEPEAVGGLLRQIARDEFNALRKSPPLLYHNDLTATVPRFYWSEEMGYAIWLRLYFENMKRQSAGGAL